MKVLIPLPDRDFDVTEVAVPWKLLTLARHEPVFATETGATPACDPKLLAGVVLGKLGAEAEAKHCYGELERTPGFQRPISWSSIQVEDFDGLLLPGGHAPGMRQYLGSPDLQARVAGFFGLRRPVAAICHGVLVLARARDPARGRSLLHGRRSTCLPKYMERAAYLATFWKLGRYYRTYPAYVQDEVTAALGSTGEFVRGPFDLGRKPVDGPRGFAVVDGNYVSARWPGDAWALARHLIALLDARRGGSIVPGAGP